MNLVVGRESESGSQFAIPEAALARHSTIFGSSGGGKTYFTYVLLREQLRRGCSLVALDAKWEAIHRLRGLCQDSGIDPDRVFVVDPKNHRIAPGFNPLLEGDPAKAVADVLKLIGDTVDVSGGRQMQFLRNALVVAAWHGISFLDVPRLLYDHNYREDVMASPTRWAKDEQYEATKEFFNGRFLAYSDSERSTSSLAVDNKFDEIRGARIFHRMFCATKNSLDFSSLFDHRQKPGVVLISTDTEGGLTESGQRLLAAAMVGAVESASAARVGTRPVVLCLDEAGVQSKYISESVGKVAALARERNLRLLLTAQFPDQLPEALRKSALENSAVKAFFRAEDEAATSSARYLAKRDSEASPLPASYEGKLLAPHGDKNILRPIQAARYTSPVEIDVDTSAPAETLKRLCADALPFYAAVYLEDGRRAVDVFKTFPQGSVKLAWRDGYAKATAKAPPRPSPDTQWLNTIMQLKPGHAVLAADGKSPVKVEIERVKPRNDADAAYIASCTKQVVSVGVTRSTTSVTVPPSSTTPPTSAPSSGTRSTKKSKSSGTGSGGTGSAKTSSW